MPRLAGHRLCRPLAQRMPGLLILVVVAALYVAGGFESIELTTMDLRFRLLGEVRTDPPEADIVLVEIDAASLRNAGNWPWPRSYHAVLIERLSAAGARTIAFDIVLNSEQKPEQDERFATAVEQARGAIVLATLRELRHDPDGTTHLVHTEPLARFRNEATMASINVHPEADGLIRRMATAYPWPTGTVPTLAAVLADQLEPDVADYWIDYSLDPTSIPRLPYFDVLQGHFDSEKVRGKVVIVGATALELNDHLQVPVFGAIEGAVLQILAAQTLKSGPLLRLTPFVGIAVAFLLIVAIAQRYHVWSWRVGLGAAVLVTVCLFALSIVLQESVRTLLDVSPAVAANLSCYAWAVLRRTDQQSLRLLLQGTEIRRKDAMMRHVVNSTFDGIVTMDGHGVVKYINPAAQRIFGYSAAEIVNCHVAHLLFDGGSSPAARAKIDGLLARQGPVELSGRRKDGGTFPIDIALSGMVVGEDVLMTAVVRDITERKRQNEILRHRALHDGLTDLPNRTLLYDRIEQEIRLARRDDRGLAVLLLDLDRFKEVNDTLGHPVGDILLRQVADRLRDSMRETDTVARLGGDEFAILVPKIDDFETVERVVAKVQRDLARPFELHGLSLEVGASVGIAFFPEHGSDASELIQRADVAMYAAKASLSGHVVYDSEKDLHSVRHLTLSGALHEAIEKDQLELHFQPKIDLARGRICGVEALSRWNHPNHGFIPPDEFIGIAERTGLIGPLTERVLHTAVARWVTWKSEGLDLNIAVNLSVQQLHDDSLPGKIVALLNAAGMPPRALTLEVTEGAFMVDPRRALATIQRLHFFGILLSIDDFGTGYSSLAYLRDLPAAELKIDRSFVKDVCSNESNRKIVQSTIALAHNLGLKVVAEGIEDDEARRLLSTWKCDVGQGYFFSRPLPADQFATWVAQTPWGRCPDGAEFMAIRRTSA